MIANMKYDRMFPTCGLVSEEDVPKYVAVIGGSGKGGIGANFVYLDSVELYDLKTETWREGT